VKPGPTLLWLAALLAGCGVNVDQRVQLYRQQQARELISQYEQARVRNDVLDMCVKSNLISAAYVDAKDHGDAQAWRARNREDCQAARAALAVAP